MYKVTMLTDGRWTPWNNYRDLEAAIDAARGLLTSDLATESKVIQVRSAADTETIIHLAFDANGAVIKK